MEDKNDNDGKEKVWKPFVWMMVIGGAVGIALIIAVVMIFTGMFGQYEKSQTSAKEAFAMTYQEQKTVDK